MLPIKSIIFTDKIDKTDWKIDGYRFLTTNPLIDFYRFPIQLTNFIDCYRMLSIIDFSDCPGRVIFTLAIKILCLMCFRCLGSVFWLCEKCAMLLVELNFPRNGRNNHPIFVTDLLSAWLFVIFKGLAVASLQSTIQRFADYVIIQLFVWTLENSVHQRHSDFLCPTLVSIQYFIFLNIHFFFGKVYKNFKVLFLIGVLRHAFS